MMPSQKRALADIAACCTRELGGRLYHCDASRSPSGSITAAATAPAPSAMRRKRRDWLEQRQVELLPCDYFHRGCHRASPIAVSPFVGIRSSSTDYSCASPGKPSRNCVRSNAISAPARHSRPIAYLDR